MMAALRYGLSLLAMIFVVAGLAVVIERLVGLRLNAATTAAVPVFMAALIAGQGACRRNGALPAAAAKLRFALMAVAVNLALVGPLLVLRSLGDPGFEAMLRGFDAVLWSVLLAAVVLVVLPGSYLAYGIGAKSQQRAEARRRSRQGEGA